jgi:hypothetical protein
MTLLRQHINEHFSVGTKALARIQPEMERSLAFASSLKGTCNGRNLSSALMRSRVRNRNRDRGGEPIRLALAVFDSLPKRSGYGISMEKDYLILKSAPASRPGEWSDDDYDVLSDGYYVGRIFRAAASPLGTPWMWTITSLRIVRITCSRTATQQRARLPWLHSPRAGAGVIRPRTH